MIRIWQRADGWTEIEGPGLMRRFQYPEEVAAFVSGFTAALSLATIQLAGMEIKDDRPVEVVPADRRLPAKPEPPCNLCGPSGRECPPF